MNWARIHTMIDSWPGGASPPIFTVSADANGTAVIELAWDPQALSAPATYENPLRYYASNLDFNANIPDADGTVRQINIPAQTIQLTGNQTTWMMPQALWDAYVQEVLKRFNSGSQPATTFSLCIYYRVHFTSTGSNIITKFPADSTFRGPNARNAPHITIIPVSATPSSQVIPDQAAVQAMGGIILAPNLWSNVLLLLWNTLPESDPERQTVVRIFAHPDFRSADVQTRGKLLKLWLFAGRSVRVRLDQLLNRQVVVGSNLTQSAISKTDYRGGKTLVDNLLALLEIIPHQDIRLLRSGEQLLNDVISEILDPNGQINQGEAGTCTTTSMQTFLIMVNPAEYARLQLGLLSSSGQVTYADGTTVNVPPVIFQINTRYPHAQNWPFLVRNFSELAFQATLLKLAMHSRFPNYDPRAHPNSSNGVNTVFQQTVKEGLYSGEYSRALKALFNVNFNLKNGVNSFHTALPRSQQPLFLVTSWGDLPGQPNHGLHAVLALRKENGRTFFKNPQYAGSSPVPGIVAGGNATNPPRRYEDPTQAIESITDADLAVWISYFFEPDAAII